MANPDFGTGKSLVVLAIVVGCFAILWPKIFYPMMQTAFAMTSPKVDTDNSFRDTDRPPHLHPGSMNPRLRNSIANDVEDKFHMREGRPFPHPQARQPVKTQPKSGGAMSIIMPIYTVGIMVFFLYTVLKLVFKKPQENEKKPLIKDFHMDPQYRKFMCDAPLSKCSEENKSNEEQSKPCETVSENEAQDLDSKDFEIFKLKKKLEETEEAMNRIMKHMGAMSACLSGMDKNISQDENSDIRFRHKGNSKQCSGKEKSKKVSDANENEIFNETKRKMLQEDLAKAMLSVAQVSMKNCSEKLLEKKPLLEQNDSVDSDEDQVECEEMEVNSDDQSESSAEEDISTDEQKINKSCYANGCCNISNEQQEKVL